MFMHFSRVCIFHLIVKGSLQFERGQVAQAAPGFVVYTGKLKLRMSTELDARSALTGGWKYCPSCAPVGGAFFMLPTSVLPCQQPLGSEPSTVKVTIRTHL